MTDTQKPSQLPKPNKPGTIINSPKPPKPTPNVPSYTIRTLIDPKKK